MSTEFNRRRGFAVLALINPERMREIASKGGLAAHANGNAHEYNSEEATIAGAKGGRAVLAKYGREHFQRLASAGGKARRERTPEHYAKMARRSVESRRRKRGL